MVEIAVVIAERVDEESEEAEDERKRVVEVLQRDSESSAAEAEAEAGSAVVASVAGVRSHIEDPVAAASFVVGAGVENQHGNSESK